MPKNRKHRLQSYPYYAFYGYGYPYFCGYGNGFVVNDNNGNQNDVNVNDMNVDFDLDSGYDGGSFDIGGFDGG